MKNFVLLASTLTVLAVVGSALTGAVSGDESDISKEASAEPAKQCCLKKGTEVVEAKAKSSCCLKGQKAAVVIETKSCKGETCNAGKKAAGECKLCGKIKQVEAKKAAAPKCKLCSEKDSKKECKDCAEARQASAVESKPASGHGKGFGKGRGRGMGHGPGAIGGMREDMTTLHTMFADRDNLKRTVKNLPNGAEATTESDDETIAGLLQEHVPAMEGRVMQNKPLPPMTFHPVFVELIKHADDYTLEYEETDKGVKATYHAEDPFVIMLVQEHAKLVSRFIKNGMVEIHKPYTLPELNEQSEIPAEPTTDKTN